MQCPSCHTDNPSANRFCDQCGETLEAHCPQCSTVLRAGARFCGACGHRLAPFAASAETSPSASPLAAPAAPSSARPIASYTPKHLADKVLKARSAIEGERRQVTVLFADIAGFTGLAEGRDPEEVHQIVDRCFEAITAEVHRFEGTINQYTGDGVMALFGAPIAHEDGARRAVHAALGIQRAMRDLSREIEAHQGPAIRMRIGLNTGPVVVGRIGDDLRMDYTAVGDTTNVAARLQQAARPGSVLVSESTLRAIGGFFETLDLGQQAVKGHAPVRAHEVLRPRRRRSRLDAAIERGLTPLVGRARELDILRERFREVLTGRGQVVFVAGEAGIGKSRLLLEFRRGLAETGEDATWLEGQCVSFGQAIPFLPIVDQLRRNFGIEEFDGEPEIIAKIEHGMRQIDDVEAHIPYIRYLLAVDPGDSTVAALDAQARRRKVFDALRALTVGGAARRPLVLVVEDLHWIDASSEEYLASLMDSVAGAPLMLILTYRVGYTPPFGTRSFHTALTLTTLPEREALAVAASVLGTEDFPRELKEALLATAEGVPLFIEEMTKTLVDLGVLRRENGGYRIVKRVSEVNVPDTIQGIIMARLDRLGEDGKRTVQLASVIGRQFLRRLLDRVSDMGERLDGLLQELKAVEIIYEQGLAPEPTYAFKHAVIQDVAYQSLLRERRRDLHRGVGYAIEDLYADRLPEHFEELAHHFVHGEEWGKAFQYLVWSGDKARLSYANQAGLDFYAKALDLAPRVSPPVPARETARVHESRANLLELTGQHEGARDAYDAAMDLVPEEDVISRSRLCREIGKTWEVQRRFEEALRLYELAEATLGEKPLEPETEWWREWIQNQLERMRTYYWIGNVSDIVMLAEKTRPRIEHDGSSSQRGTFFSLLTLMALRRDRYIASTETVSYAEAAVAASLESDDQTELVWTRFVLGFALLWHGELQRAEQELRDVLSLAERVGDVTTRARILTYLTIVRRKCVDVKGVREYATRSLAASAPGQMIEYVGMAKANLAWAAQREGNLDEALELGRNAYELLQPLPQGAMFNWVYRWPLLSLALARDQLSEAIDHARALLSPTTQPPPEAVAAALNAAMHFEEAGKPEDVRRCLLRASEMARQDGYL